jgi:hypothetical protein
MIRSFILCIALVQSLVVSSAESPQVLLSRMLARDFVGDPAARMALCDGEPTGSLTCGSKEPSGRFDLDADPIWIASSWRVDRNSTKCTKTECTVVARFLVHGFTVGEGVPSLLTADSREIISLPECVEQIVAYQFVFKRGSWRLVFFPRPYVSLDVLSTFFENELRHSPEPGLSAPLDQRAIQNKQIVLSWRVRQISLLKSLPLQKMQK